MPAFFGDVLCLFWLSSPGAWRVLLSSSTSISGRLLVLLSSRDQIGRVVSRDRIAAVEIFGYVGFVCILSMV